jgi:hypothetical protein
MTRIAAVSLFVLGALVAGCAGAPPAPVADAHAVSDCNHLRARIAIAEDEKRAALDKQESAWKVVIPFAVIAQFASGKAATQAADQRLGELDSQSRARGCSS